jgi:hypothetical protein
MLHRTRSWVIFFAALLLLATAAVSLETWYNLRQQLSPEALEQARVIWRAKGPADYDLKYVVIRQTRSGERLRARLRDGVVTGIEIDGTPLDPALVAFHDLTPLFAELPSTSPTGEREVSATAPERSTARYRVEVRRGQVARAWYGDDPVPAALAERYTVAGLFDGLGRFVADDQSSGIWRPYAVAMFDRTDGHLMHYVRSRMRARERVEFSLLEWKPQLEPGVAQAPTPP